MNIWPSVKAEVFFPLRMSLEQSYAWLMDRGYYPGLGSCSVRLEVQEDRDFRLVAITKKTLVPGL